MNYEIVPNIISCKDLDYISDMFNWNLGAYKKTQNSINKIETEEIINMVSRVSNVFKDNAEELLQILNQGGYNG